MMEIISEGVLGHKLSLMTIVKSLPRRSKSTVEELEKISMNKNCAQVNGISALNCTLIMENSLMRRSRDEVDIGETIPPLFIAIYNIDESRVLSEVSQLSSYELNNLKYAGQYSLHAACQVKGMGILRCLLIHGAKVCLVNSVGNTPLHVAVTGSWTEGVRELLAHGANPNVLTKAKSKVKGVILQTPLHIAVRLRATEIVSEILKYNPVLNIKDSQCKSLIHLAAQSHSFQIIKLLLEKDDCKMVLMNTDENGNTPLHSLMNSQSQSTNYQVVECAEILIQEGISIDSFNSFGETALYLACANNLPQVVSYLLSEGADPTLRTEGGKSTLHASCRAGSHACLKHILNTNRVANLVLEMDCNENVPFHYAVKSFSIDCCELLLSNGDHLTNTDKDGKTRCSLITMNLPNATELLTRMFDSNTKASSKHIHDPSFSVTFRYSSLFDVDNRCVQLSIINEFPGGRFENLLKHPLLESFLYVKWNRIKPFFYTSVLVYFLFLINYTTYLMKTYGGKYTTDWSNSNYSSYLLTFRVLHWLFAGMVFIPNSITVFENFKKNFFQFETFIKLIVLLTSSFLICISTSDYDFVFQINMASLAVLLGWLELMFLLGRFPTFGVYILMFMTISKSIIKFLIAFSFIIIGYACAFEIIFQGVDTFKTLPLTLMKTLMMMVGEIEYGDIYESANFTRLFSKHNGKFHVYANDSLRILFLVSFLFLVPVLLANLLIGLAVNDLPDLKRHGKIRRLAKQASYIIFYEKLLFFFKRQAYFPNMLRKLLSNFYRICSEVTYYPNKKVHNKKWHLRIPSETLKEAIIVGTKIEEDISDMFCSPDEDLNSRFQSFYRRYEKDKKCTDNKLNNLEKEMKDNSHGKEILMALTEIQKELKDHKNLINSLKQKG